MSQPRKLQIRPYARLITMLGEQLIKNERIALIELIKNSYDADAEWVKVTFENFGENYKITKYSKIIIEDDGCGMNTELIEKHWLNPATPEKKKRKQKKDTTSKGRIIQGEKGIGRFAIFKLGRDIDIITKTKSSLEELLIQYKFSKYDDDFLQENGKDIDLFIDELNVQLTVRQPITIIDSEITIGTRKKQRKSHGTRIEISNLKGSWTENKVESVYKDLTKLESIFSKKDKKDFEVFIYKDKDHQSFQEDFIEKLKFLLEERSVIKIEKGVFDSKLMEYNFILNGDRKKISLFDPVINGLKPFKDRFGNAGEVLREREIECGSFNFDFFIFDFSSKAPPKFKLDNNDRKLLKQHRIYLYRDDIRVYPYGEPEDDWLQIDMFRGTISAGHFLSNDQVVGVVNISQKNNPKLQDKTNREGLISEGDATEDFITVLQSILFYIRHKPYRKYQIDLQNKESQNIYKSNNVKNDFDELKNAIGDNKKAQKILSKTEKEYKKEKEFLTQRAETTEDLAGVGLSVETASHDIMGIMGKVFTNLDDLLRDLMSGDDIDRNELIKELQSIRGGMSFIEAQLKDIQLLFRSSKQRRKTIRVIEILEKVERIYRRLLKKESIAVTINSIGSPLVAKTTDAVLLQLLLNLFDNAVYWLLQTTDKKKEIEILLDGNKGRMIFSDNGPGVNVDDIPYIFEPFYSGKGEDGRGLGLYIARQLLERNDYSIDIAEIKSDKLLPGANFIVNFFSDTEK